MAEPADAVEARPWNPSDGPGPQVLVYPPDARPSMWVRAGGEWRHGTVVGRHDYRGGRHVYQIEVRLPDERDGIEGTHTRLYEWPQPGLKAASQAA